jgi:bifunctional DNA-binding transcriptional regulator/antitoxin component of YhaV-PrlF toxin-antitoxin module
MTSPDVRRSILRKMDQLTLPTEVRRALHIDVDDEIEFEIVEGGRVLMRGLNVA